MLGIGSLGGTDNVTCLQQHGNDQHDQAGLKKLTMYQVHHPAQNSQVVSETS